MIKKQIKILVTGGAGNIGTNLCKELSLRGHKVISSDLVRPNGIAFSKDEKKPDDLKEVDKLLKGVLMNPFFFLQWAIIFPHIKI